MKQTIKWTIILLVFALLTVNFTQIDAFQVLENDFEEINQELANLEPYIKDVNTNGVKLQEFDTESAIKAGFSKEVILIAENMVAYQNDLAIAITAQNITDITQLPLPEDQYPYLQAFLAQATEQQIYNDSIAAVTDDVNPCGDWDHPVPDYTPSRPQYSSSDPHQALLDLGYHNTAGYACGGDPLETCENDYTKGRSYTGAYGTCSSPRFRNQGIAGTTYYSIQYGEPNPEILAYSWPYWNWGVYVRWWHDNY